MPDQVQEAVNARAESERTGVDQPTEPQHATFPVASWLKEPAVGDRCRAHLSGVGRCIRRHGHHEHPGEPDARCHVAQIPTGGGTVSFELDHPCDFEYPDRGNQSPAERLQWISKMRESLAAEEQRIFTDSVSESDPGLKVAQDSVAQAMGAEPSWPPITYPIEVNGIKWADRGAAYVPWRPERGAITPWVQCRPLGQTSNWYLGITVGYVALTYGAQLSPDGVLSIGPRTPNPAIWVPDLGYVVHGCECDWAPIKSSEDLAGITVSDASAGWFQQATSETRSAEDVEGSN